ncbi:hypothetical protein [Ferrimonas senticii]|uniref:hypothetical protein n=1 Tax=Ferrimonas senticii TaxID=394566 RepID=UPI0012EC1864|nr:hypothetical protein [Ferrimonas senticii]
MSSIDGLLCADNSRCNGQNCFAIGLIILAYITRGNSDKRMAVAALLANLIAYFDTRFVTLWREIPLEQQKRTGNSDERATDRRQSPISTTAAAD